MLAAGPWGRDGLFGRDNLNGEACAIIKAHCLRRAGASAVALAPHPIGELSDRLWVNLAAMATGCARRHPLCRSFAHGSLFALSFNSFVAFSGWR